MDPSQLIYLPNMAKKKKGKKRKKDGKLGERVPAALLNETENGGSSDYSSLLPNISHVHVPRSNWDSQMLNNFLLARHNARFSSPVLQKPSTSTGISTVRKSFIPTIAIN